MCKKMVSIMLHYLLCIFHHGENNFWKKMDMGWTAAGARLERVFLLTVGFNVIIQNSYNHIQWYTVLQKEYILLWSHKIWNGLFGLFCLLVGINQAGCENILSYGFFQNWGILMYMGGKKEKTNLTSCCSSKLFYS